MLSSTDLETYAACPYRYFLRASCAVKPLDEPEAIIDADALTKRDARCTTVLERFLASLPDGRLDQTRPDAAPPAACARSPMPSLDEVEGRAGRRADPWAADRTRDRRRPRALARHEIADPGRVSRSASSRCASAVLAGGGEPLDRRAARARRADAAPRRPHRPARSQSRRASASSTTRAARRAGQGRPARRRRGAAAAALPARGRMLLEQRRRAGRRLRSTTSPDAAG